MSVAPYKLRLNVAVILFVNTVKHIPEVVTGLIGTTFIVAAAVDSIRYNRRTLGA